MSNSSTFEMNNICIFIDSGRFNEGEEVDIIFRILKCWGFFFLFVGGGGS